MNKGYDRQAIAAFFKTDSDAINAIRDLHSAGFRSDQIGCSCDDVMESSLDRDNAGMSSDDRGMSSDDRNVSGRDRSFWDKVGGFFTGEDDDRDRSSQDEGFRGSDQSMYRIPDTYNDRLSSGGSLVTVHAQGRLAEAEQILSRNRGEIDREFSMTGDSSDSSASNARTAMTGDTHRERMQGDNRMSGDMGGQRHIQLLSERLRVNKERVQAGEVRLRKEVRTERQNIEVPVTREELVIERVATDKNRPANSQIGRDQEIRVPLSEEQVKVEKSPVVREEVRVGKREVQETQNVSDETRHEELQVDDETKMRDRKRPKRDAA